MSGPFILLAIAGFVALIGFMYTWRFLLWVFTKGMFNSLTQAFAYAFLGSALLTFALWLFMVALPGIEALA